mgnify:CR=1 FL=1
MGVPFRITDGEEARKRRAIDGNQVVFASMRTIAGNVGSFRPYSFHAALLLISAGAVRTVKAFGSRPCFTCAQASGIETVAPARAGRLSGATAVAMRSLRR